MMDTGMIVTSDVDYMRLKGCRRWEPDSQTLASVALDRYGESFIDRMIGLVEAAKRQKMPNEIALSILLSALTIIFLAFVAKLRPFGLYFGVDLPIVNLVSLLVPCFYAV
jgi:high-affinity K+ transport system ATPase subunit B